jgi:sarcosine oxidase subunit gamma
MHDATSMARRIGSLDGAISADDVGGVTLAAAPPAARFILRGSAAVAEAVSAPFGAPLPHAINTASTGSDGRAAFKIGPDEWLLVAPGGDAGDLFAAIEGAGAEPHSLVDVSHRQTAILVEGPRAADTLNAAVPLDLSPEAFPVGMATRTIFEKAEIVLWRPGPQVFRIEVWRSFSPYVLGLIEEVRQENAGEAALS